MTYSIKEMFYTLQGEGNQAGRPAVFCRFAGCNLWSGREQDRASAICTFCDTDFVGTDGLGGGKFKDANGLALAINSLWPISDQGHKYVVLTGGEPLLQVDDALVEALHKHSFTVAVETNGTIIPPSGIDWICVSPKSTAELKITQGDELKLVFPQTEAQPEKFEHLTFNHFYLQPMDGPESHKNTELTIKYCKSHPKWKLGLQMHKVLMIP
ncbi:7-carboxy-7-deazaguanine synthase [Pseudomonas sp. TH39(2020)]|uniref:7-carboxy-7-deazaguanine synthase n=1 Tax=Pseudomonas sp. TH39(2020) TaxID=2796349 RepID=UPI001912D55C|nr:7-carboxy-7-deazaguanine synthase [Pseudomonas sp. TH39(2020)]MBK5395432.1 7-carboxy-7-deazaguanine synthase [Pseudomonas sp. TH39(2020)]